MALKLGPRDALRWLTSLMLGVFALGAAAVTIIVAAGKLGLRLIPGLAMDLLIATTAWWSLALTAVTACGFAAAAVLMIRRSKLAFWGWLVGFAAACASQALETAAANQAGSETDPSGAMILAFLGLLGWGAYVLTYRRPRGLPRR